MLKGIMGRIDSPDNRTQSSHALLGPGNHVAHMITTARRLRPSQIADHGDLRQRAAEVIVDIPGDPQPFKLDRDFALRCCHPFLPTVT